jgi:hypothetical protein
MTKISLWILVALGTVACSGPKPEPRIASSAGEAGYAVEYPAALQSLTAQYANAEGEVRKISAELPKYPDQLKAPAWPHVLEIVERADAAGGSASYAGRRRETEGARTFFAEEKDDITKKVAGSVQYAAKKKECDFDAYGPAAGALKDAVDKQLEKRLRARNEAHFLIDRYRDSLGKANAQALEKQADDISRASYIANIELVAVKVDAARLLADADQVKKTLDRAISEEQAFQAATGRSASEKKASAERVGRMNESKARVDSAATQTQSFTKDLEQRNETLKKEYVTALDALTKAISSRAGVK